MKPNPSFLIGVLLGITACNNGRIGVMTKFTHGDIVDYCNAQWECDSKLDQELFLYSCVDSLIDEKHTAVAYDCEDDFNELMTCRVSAAEDDQCRSEYEDYEDWYDDHYGDTGSPSADPYPCRDEEQEYDQCIEAFLYSSNGSSTKTDTPEAE